MKGGNNLKGPVLYLWSSSPLLFFILVPFVLIKSLISVSFIISISSIVTAAKSSPLFMSTRHVTFTYLNGTNLSKIIFPFIVVLAVFKISPIAFTATWVKEGLSSFFSKVA
jgi:hypothetical protein